MTLKQCGVTPAARFASRYLRHGISVVAGVWSGTGKVMFADFALHLLGEPLPLLGHFSQERLEPWINRAARFLEASRRESPIFSRVLHIAPPGNGTAFAAVCSARPASCSIRLAIGQLQTYLPTLCSPSIS